MPALSPAKRGLYDVLRRDIAAAGVRVLLLSPPDEWPQIYALSRDDESARVRAYLWPLTYDTARGDWKFQIGSIPEHVFIHGNNAQTVVMGYYADLRLYLAADAERRRGRFGQSVAVQTRKPHLDQANREGFAAFEKVGSHEIALVIRHDFIATYLLNVREVHELGELPNGVRTIDHIAETLGSADAPDVDAAATALAPRERNVVTFTRSVRAADFRKRVMLAYENQCAVCAIQLRLVEAAHIVPAGAEMSSDETCNGMALCAIHHAAYDGGILGILPDLSVAINDSATRALVDQQLGGGLEEFKKSLRPSIIVPYNKSDQPLAQYLETGLRQRGWKI